MLKFINILFYTVFVTLLLSIAGLLIASMLPIPGNIEIKIVKSGSMEPTIPTGSLVVVKPSSSYSIGDVVTFGADTKTEIPTTHRIIGFESDADGRSVYRTKGDANEDQDANPVGRGEVIGKVAFHLPYVGFVLDFARQPLGFALLIGVPAALVILEEVITITREVKAALRRRKKDGSHDDDDSAGTILREVAKERVVYLRRRSMDEIFVPMMTNTSTWIKENVPAPKDGYASATLAVIGIVSVSTLMSGGASGTIAYFQDIEKSAGNFFQAGSGPDFLGESEPEIDAQLLRTAILEEETEGEVAGAATEATSDESDQEPLEEPTGSAGGGSGLPPEESTDQTTPIEPQDSVEEPAVEPEAPEEPVGQTAVEQESSTEQTPPIDPPAAETPAPETIPEPLPEPSSPPPAETPAPIE